MAKVVHTICTSFGKDKEKYLTHDLGAYNSSSEVQGDITERRISRLLEDVPDATIGDLIYYLSTGIIPYKHYNPIKSINKIT